MAQVQSGSITLHRVPAALLRAAGSDDVQPVGGWPATVVRLLAAALPDEPFNRPDSWPQLAARHWHMCWLPSSRSAPGMRQPSM